MVKVYLLFSAHSHVVYTGVPEKVCFRNFNRSHWLILTASHPVVSILCVFEEKIINQCHVSFFGGFDGDFLCVF